MRTPLNLLAGRSWTTGLVQLLCFAALFATYDLKILARQRHAPHGVSLVNYIVRDGRTDESAMYMPAVRELVDGQFSSTDPYLKDYREAPDIRPRLPVWIGYACHWLGARSIAGLRVGHVAIGGETNAAVVLMHALPPALAAMLLVRLFSTLVGPGMGFVAALLAVGSVCYQFNDYINALRLTHLGGPISYNPEFHLAGPYSMHLEFNRYFSPGITLAVFLLGLLPLALDPDFQRPRTSIWAGAAIGLQLEAYPHAALVLAAVAASLLAFALRRQIRDDGLRRAARSTALRAATMAAACVAVASPWLMRWVAFRQLPAAADILQRVGLLDERIDTQRTPILVWLAIALLLRRAANRAVGRPPGEMLATPTDRFWSAAMLAALVTVWIPGLFGHYGLFPQPWLIPLRCLSFLVPALVAYPAVLWFRAARPRWTHRRLARSLGIAAVIAYAALLFHGEYAAGRNNAHLYAVTPEIARCRDAVLANTPPQAIVLCDDLRLVSYLVCETDRYTYIGYGASSNASTDELLERLMIPCILQGLSFDRFHADYYVAGHGLPQGPTGAHWALHHGGDARPIAVERLRQMYDALTRLAPQEVIDRYPFDALYLDPPRLDARFRPLFEPTANAWLQRRIAK